MAEDDDDDDDDACVGTYNYLLFIVSLLPPAAL